MRKTKNPLQKTGTRGLSWPQMFTLAAVAAAAWEPARKRQHSRSKRPEALTQQTPN